MNIRIISIFAFLCICSVTFTQSISPVKAQSFLDNLIQPDSAAAADGKKTIKSSEDAYVNKDSQKSNYGKSKYLKVGGDYESYLKFKVSNNVSSAILRVYNVSGKGSGVSAYSTSTSWSQSKLTWKNRPKAKDKLDSGSAKSKYVEFDVTEGVKKGTVAFVLRGGKANFYSREGKKDPELIINGSSGGNDPTPKPEKTPKPGDPNPTDEPNPTEPGCGSGIDCNPDPSEPPTGGPCEPGFDCEPDTTPDPNEPGSECDTTIDCDNDGEPGGNPTNPPATNPPGATATPANRPPATNAPTNPPNNATNPPVGGGGSTGTIAPDANTKMAFIGDSADGQGQIDVLRIIKGEGAQAVLHAGDLSYSSDMVTFEKNVTTELGANFPFFISKGNHDGGVWADGLANMNKRNAANGLPTVSGTSATYDLVYKNIKIAVSEGKTPATITSQLSADNHIWKICSWHYNMKAIQVGGKGDDANWGSYENCRQYGAFVLMGHEHSYERTKTITKYPTSSSALDFQFLPDPANIMMSRGSNFSVVSGAGGNGVRVQKRCSNPSEAGCGIWASIRTSTQGAKHGALIITFNPGGNRPKEAEAYYKEVGGAITDRFTLRAQ